MKKSILVAVVTVLTVSSVLTSCNTTADDVKETREEVKEAKKDLQKAENDYFNDVEKYKKENRENIIANEKIIADFKVKIDLEKKEARADYNTRIAYLEKKNEDLKVKMNTYQPLNEQNWEKFKTEFSRDMEELGTAFKDFTIKNSK